MTDVRSNVLTLVSGQASKITSVSLYSGHAEVTRCFPLGLKEGQNEVTIRGLPLELWKDSVRVEGRGHASIHDVVISKTPRDQYGPTEHFAKKETMKRKKQELEQEIVSVKQARKGLDVHLDALLQTSTENDFSKLESMLGSYRELSRKFDKDILDLGKEFDDVSQSLKLLKEDSMKDDVVLLPWQVLINIQAKISEEVEFYIKYVVSNADWSATYDIRAETQNQVDNMITIFYKASITQNTGESWDNVPLTLETATPTLSIFAPDMLPWVIGEVKARPPQPVTYPPAGSSGSPRYFSPPMPMPMPFFQSEPAIPPSAEGLAKDSGSTASSNDAGWGSWGKKLPKPAWRVVPTMQHRAVSISNKGSVTATFRIPGYISVPSDTQQHNVTISTFEFKARLLWRTVPKANVRAYMEAKITNDSEYTFIPGSANIYIDGSFVATTLVPSVSPQESFDCALGLDPSLRVTYHPREFNVVSSGLYKKTTTRSFTQRISVLNTKSVAIENLKVIDYVPISEDSRIDVKLISPALSLPQRGDSLRRSISMNNGEKGKEANMPRVQVSAGVVAQWKGTGDRQVNQDMVGKDGQVLWVVSKLRPQETVTLVLKCEISAPEGIIMDSI